ncbi:endolytic transglycosylase MltG [bacterium]|nr:endolytic transglycosylase MltG [bacterium]
MTGLNLTRLYIKPERSRIFLVFISFLLIGLILNGLAVVFHSWMIESSEGVTVSIEHGISSADIALKLYEERVIPNVKYFVWSARALNVGPRLQAGTYYFHGRTSNYSILMTMAAGHVLNEQITFPEGLRATQIAGICQHQMNIDSISVMQLVNDRNFTRSLEINADRLEGYLFPNTYFFHKNATAEDVLMKMVHEFKCQFSDSLKMLARDRGLTVHDVVTLASIVEGEAIIAKEREIIAAIYLNRLHRGMALQACPTVQYLLPEGPRRLLKKDLEIKSPYNTYLHPGLPPGPVNNPGLASILAVLNPAPVDYLYLVANGDDTHTFSRSMDEHVEAKHRFNRVRQYYRQ